MVVLASKREFLRLEAELAYLHGVKGKNTIITADVPAKKESRPKSEKGDSKDRSKDKSVKQFSGIAPQSSSSSGMMSLGGGAAGVSSDNPLE
jgi:hypothetical protein